MNFEEYLKAGHARVVVIDLRESKENVAVLLTALYTAIGVKRLAAQNRNAAPDEEKAIHSIIDALPIDDVKDVFHTVCQFMAILMADKAECDKARELAEKEAAESRNAV